MAEDFISAEKDVQEDVTVESQSTEDIDGQEEGLDLSNAGDGAQTEKKDDLTKKMSERINQVRAKEVEPLKTKLSEYEKKEAEYQQAQLELKALKEGKTVDEVKAEQAELEKTQRELIQNDPEVQRLNAIVIEHQKAQLLNELRTEFPDDNITGIDDLGDDYKRMLMSGVHPFNAYMAIRDMNVKNQPPKKELPGSVKSDGKVIEKDYYTPDEVDLLTDKQLSDPSVWKKVRESMTKW